MQTEAERTATERKRRVEKYFHRTPDRSELNKAILVLACAGILFVVTLAMFATVALLGIVFLVATAYVGYKGFKRYQAYQELYREAEPKPTGRELDALLAADLSNIERKAMYDLGLTEEDLETGSQEWDPVAALGRGELGRPSAPSWSMARRLVADSPSATTGSGDSALMR